MVTYYANRGIKLCCAFMFLIACLLFALHLVSNLTEIGHSQSSEGLCRLKFSGNPERNVKVLVFIDSSFADVFFNWLDFYQASCGTSSHNNTIRANNLLDVYCMDDPVPYIEKLRLRGVQCVSNNSVVPLVSPSHGGLTHKNLREQLGNVWTWRLQIISQYLANNVDVLLSDVDAVWLDNPFPHIARYSVTAAPSPLVRTGGRRIPPRPQAVDTDIIASRGIFPFDLGRKWGAALCMGFVYFKATSFNVELLSNCLANMQHLTAVAANASKLSRAAFVNGRATGTSMSDNPGSGSSSSSSSSSSIAKKQKNRHGGKDVTLIPDDQVAVNVALDRWNISWSPISTATAGVSRSTGVNEINVNSVDLSSSKKMITIGNVLPDVGVVLRDDNIIHRIVLLPHDKFIRYCSSSSSSSSRNSNKRNKKQATIFDTNISTATATVVSLGADRWSGVVVAHCRVPKSTGKGDSKKEAMSRLGLWKE